MKSLKTKNGVDKMFGIVIYFFNKFKKKEKVLNNKKRSMGDAPIPSNEGEWTN